MGAVERADGGPNSAGGDEYSTKKIREGWCVPVQPAEHSDEQQQPIVSLRRKTEWTLFRLVIILLVCFFVAVFAVENEGPVRLTFLGMTAPGIRLSILLFAVLLIGGLACLALAGPEIIRLRRELRDLKQTVRGQPRSVADVALDAPTPRVGTPNPEPNVADQLATDTQATGDRPPLGN